MKENKKGRNKGVVITLSIAVIMIALCAVLMNTILAHAAQPTENEIHADSISQSLNAEELDPAMQENLNIIVYHNGIEPSADGVTAQYAAAVTSEIAERVYDKPLKGRVFILLGKEEQELFWNVSAEVDGGTIRCAIKTDTGEDVYSRYFEETADWAWFDNWNEEAAESERAAVEQGVPPAGQPSDEGYSEEEMATLIKMKRESMLEFAASMVDTPFGSKAVELVNALGIGDGASAVSGAVMQGMQGDADPGYYTYYVVEVQLDNGKYVFVDLTADNMQVLGYRRSDVTLAEQLYG